MTRLMADFPEIEGVNCLIVRGPHLQHYRLHDTRTGQTWRPDITGDPYQWRWVLDTEGEAR